MLNFELEEHIQQFIKYSTISSGHFDLLHLDTPSTQYAYVTAGVFHCLQWDTLIISLEIHTNLKEEEERGINTSIINIHWF